MKYVLILALLLFNSIAFGEKALQEKRKQRILRDMKKRYQSYLKYQQEKETFEVQRIRNREDHKKKRLLYAKKYDAARAQFAEDRKKRKVVEKDDSAYLAALKKYQEKRNLSRKEYIELRNLLKNTKARGQTIPPYEELGINP